MPRPFTYLQYLPAFEAAARLGSIRAAADELNLSPSAISLQLKKLSEAIGMDLFKRNGRNITLTTDGREFSQTTALVLSLLQTASRLANSKSVGRMKSLAISVPISLGIAGLSGALVAFANRFSLSNFSVNEACAASDIDWHANDIAIVYDSPPFPGKSWWRLSGVTLCPICSPVLVSKLNITRRDRPLDGVSLLHEDQGEEWAKWSAAARVSLHGSPRVKMGSVAQAIACAIEGHGMALVSDALVHRHLTNGLLIQPFSTRVNAAHDYYLLCAPACSEDAVIKSLIETMRDYFAPDRKKPTIPNWEGAYPDEPR